MRAPHRSRTLIIILIAVIMVCCTASAILGMRDGHVARPASTFFAGLAFSILIWTRLPKKSDTKAR